jgi:hypothetical protein
MRWESGRDTEGNGVMLARVIALVGLYSIALFMALM